METNIIYNNDCISDKGMCRIPDKSINMVLCDLPYGTTACSWDTIIPFDKLWEQYERIIKDNGAIILTASQPFTSLLVTSNLKLFKYCWIWDKVKPSGFQIARYKPMLQHEDICVFYKKAGNYNPLKTKRSKIKQYKQYSCSDSNSLAHQDFKERTSNFYYPKTIIKISNANQNDRIHPTQKPVALFEYLIKTYTNENDIVLDNCIGSGTTAIACINTNRKYIGFEKDKEYFQIANRRINFESNIVNIAERLSSKDFADLII